MMLSLRFIFYEFPRLLFVNTLITVGIYVMYQIVTVIFFSGFGLAAAAAAGVRAGYQTVLPSPYG